jgi:signal transduction histidine kinase
MATLSLTKPDQRLDDLAEIIRAYNQVTADLQRSHETLHAEVTRLQQELASSNAALQRSKRLAALGEMAAGIAHEIRNPLAAIHLYARMLVEDLPAGSETGQTAGKIADAVRGLNAIVCDVLAFARELRPRPMRLRVMDVFHRTVDAHRPALDAAKVSVRYAMEPEDLLITADNDLMHQAMLNLLRNAVDAGATAIALSAHVEDGMVVLGVRDNGPGIPDESIDRIFNPFFTTRDTGTGLGLAIVHRIIDAHGGAIRVSNSPQGGARFELVLPMEQPTPANHACAFRPVHCNRDAA